MLLPVLKAVLLLLLWLPGVVCAGLSQFQQHVVHDPQDFPLPSAGVRITYLGVNGYLLESRGTSILVDPYFTRTPFVAVALNLHQLPSRDDLAFAATKLPRHVDAILVTHGHFDHLLDVPPIAQTTGAMIVASPTSIFLARAAGVTKVNPVTPGQQYRVKGAKVCILPASHDCVLGRVPFPGHRHAMPPKPRRPSDWVCGEPLAFLVEMGGQRIYLDSGGTSQVLPPENLGRIDLAIMGVALPDSRARLRPALPRLRPRYFLPSHQDNFFRSAQRGFSFGWLTNFRQVIHESAGHRLILLDYFAPWTLR